MQVCPFLLRFFFAIPKNILVFILYVIAIIVVTFGIVIYVAPRYGRSNILVYISVCSLIGSLSVISVKGLGLAIKETIMGSQQFTNMLTWFWLLSVIACVSVQLVRFSIFLTLVSKQIAIFALLHLIVTVTLEDQQNEF